MLHGNFDLCIRWILGEHGASKTDCRTVLCVDHREKLLKFSIDRQRFPSLKRNAFGVVNWRRKKGNPAHCEMFKYKLLADGATDASRIRS